MSKYNTIIPACSHYSIPLPNNNYKQERDESHRLRLELEMSQRDHASQQGGPISSNDVCVLICFYTLKKNKQTNSSNKTSDYKFQN